MSQVKVENFKRKMPPQEDPPRSPRETLPTMYDLPSEEIGESGLPDEFHVFQSQLLRETFQTQEYSIDEVFIGTDINLYYDVTTNWYKRPDWFACVGVPRLYDNQTLRLSYLVWQERANPLIVVELLSPSTEKEDLGQKVKKRVSDNDPPSKWEVYQTILRVPFYFTYDHLSQQIRAFRLEGDSYISFLPDKDGRFFLPSVSVYLGLWQGSYQNINETWLRWFDHQGNLIPTPLEKEVLEKERERAEKERERAEKETERTEKEALEEKLAILNEKLKAMGIDPNSL